MQFSGRLSKWIPLFFLSFFLFFFLSFFLSFFLLFINVFVDKLISFVSLPSYLVFVDGLHGYKTKQRISQRKAREKSAWTWDILSTLKKMLSHSKTILYNLLMSILSTTQQLYTVYVYGCFILLFCFINYIDWILFYLTFIKILLIKRMIYVLT